MRKPTIALDVDNTIADTNAALLGFLPGIDIKKYPTPGITLEFFEHNPWIFTDTLPIKGAVEGVQYLSQYFEIMYLTARPKWAKGITCTWLDRHGFPEGLVRCTDDKPDWINKLGVNLAIDDSPKEIIAISKQVPVFIFQQPYNIELAHIGKLFTWSESYWVSKIMAYVDMSIAL